MAVELPCGILRGRILHCLPGVGNQDFTVECLQDGILVHAEGKIVALLPAAQALAQGMDLTNCRTIGPGLLVPGFIDTHVHAPQLEVMGSHSEQLLDWLQRHTFPAEMRFADEDFARLAMADFLDALIREGTTSAMVYATSHYQATDALFAAAAERDMCMVAGKVLMDRNAPLVLQDCARKGISNSRKLIELWHGNGRLHYAVTPRFAITSSAEQLQGAGLLLAEFPTVYLQTHLSENREEVARVRQLFPNADHYLDTYDRYGLCGERSVFAHCLHLEPGELTRLAESGSKVAFCPSSNLFLGSGLFDWAQFDRAGITVTLASDVGAGTSLSMLSTLSDANKVGQLGGAGLDPMHAFYTITLGNARALGLERRIGNLSPGSDADFLILDPEGVPLLSRRLDVCRSINEEWFACMILGDDRLVRETWIAGVPRKQAAPSSARQVH